MVHQSSCVFEGGDVGVAATGHLPLWVGGQPAQLVASERCICE